MIERTTLFAALLGVTACGPTPESEVSRLADRNYLQDVDFALEAGSSRSKHWTGLQHTGEKSFDVTIADGVVSIARVGSQPWFLYRQRLAAPELAGQCVAFSARMRLLEGHAEGVAGMGKTAGLNFSTLSSGKTELRLEQRLDAEVTAGEWQTLQIVAQVPRYTDTLELSFMHETAGVLEVGAPSLRHADPMSAACTGTPAG